MLKKKEYKNGQKRYDIGEGILVFYFDNGEIESYGKFSDNLQQGEWIYYHRSGEVAQLGSFVDGLKEGRWIQFNCVGDIDVDAVFNAGQRIR